MFGLGVQELVLILVIAMFFFGGKKLPEIAKGLGKGIREFKRASEGGADDEDEHISPRDTKSPRKSLKASLKGLCRGGKQACLFPYNGTANLARHTLIP